MSTDQDPGLAVASSKPRSAVVVALLLATAACSTPIPSLTATPLPSNPDGIPAGNIIAIDHGVEIAADNLTVTLRFIGGQDLPATDPCDTEYVGWARPGGVRLEVAVVQVVDVHPPPASGCSAVGFDRQVVVVLSKPFLGTTAVDRGGGELLVQRPSPS